jgi:hypothetical protein
MIAIDASFEVEPVKSVEDEVGGGRSRAGSAE